MYRNNSYNFVHCICGNDFSIHEMKRHMAIKRHTSTELAKGLTEHAGQGGGGGGGGRPARMSKILKNLAAKFFLKVVKYACVCFF